MIIFYSAFVEHKPDGGGEAHMPGTQYIYPSVLSVWKRTAAGCSGTIRALIGTTGDNALKPVGNFETAG